MFIFQETPSKRTIFHTTPFRMSFPLSCVDLAQPPVHVELLLVYENKEKKADVISDVQRGIQSLTNYYPFLAGRVRNKQIEIENDSQIFVELEKDSNELSSYGFSGEGNCFRYYKQWPENLVVFLTLEQRESVFLVKVTEFECGGVSIGISFHHQVLDAHGCTIILKTLSKLINGQDIEERFYEYETSKQLIENYAHDFEDVMLPPVNGYLALPFAQLAGLRPPVNTDPIEFRIMKVNTTNLTQLKNTINSQIPADSKLTSNDVICGIISKLICSLPHDENEKLDFLYAVDARNLIRPNLPEGFVSNFAFLRKVSLSTDLTLQECCQAFRKSLIETKQNPNIVNKHIAWMKSYVENATPHIILPGVKLGADFPSILLSNWSRLPLHEIQLVKNENPIYAGIPRSQSQTKMTGIGILYSSNEGDLLLGMALKYKHFVTLAEKQEFRQFFEL